APKAGATWKATFQLWWASLVPQFSAYAEASLQTRGGLAYRYTIPAEANVTLGVYDNQGHLLRWITRGAHRRAGTNVEYWDGLDQWGKPLAAGTYQVKGIAFPPVGLDYQFTIGNPGTPPWPTSDNKGDWLADESSPQGVATDGDWVYLAAPCAEKGWSIIGVDGTGQRQWGFGINSNPRCVSLAVQGNYLYALYSGPETTTTSRSYKSGTGQGRDILYCLDKRTGKLASFSQANPALIINRWPYREEVAYLWDLRANKTFNAGNYGGQPRYFLSDVGESTNALGIAATADRVYISCYYDDKLLVLDAVTAKQVDEIPVPKPVGLRALPNGKLLAVSGVNVLEIDPQTKATRVVVKQNLVAPHDITTDKDGQLYVSDWGTSFQVKVFSAAGVFLRAVGTPGGRPWVGKWDANGMLVPRGIAVTDAGKLWVAEDDTSPSRVSLWDAKAGTLIKDYIGPSAYGGGNWFWVNPQDPTMVLTEGALFHVDYAKKTWAPVSTALRRLSFDQPFMPNGAAGIPTAKTVLHNGKTYVYVSSGLETTALRLDGNVFTPVASVGQLSAELSVDGTAFDDWDSDLGHHRYMNCRPAFFRGHGGHIYCWVDQNGDGLVQENEMQWAPMERSNTPLPAGHFGRWESSWGTGIGPDGSLYFRTTNGKQNLLFRLDVDQWTAGGAPVYTLANAHKIIDSDEMRMVNGLYVTAQNKLIVSYALEWAPLPKNMIECYDRDGQNLWAVATYTGAQQLDDPAATNMSGDFAIPGIGNVIGSWQWHLNQHSYLLTDDGLYLAMLCDDNVSGPTQNWGESMRSYFQTPTGDAYLVNGGADSYHFLRITGLQNAQRFTAPLVLTDADVQIAAESRQAAATAPLPTPKPIIRTNWVSKPPVIDGDLSGWNMAAGAVMTASNNRAAEVALGRDATNLYLAYRVHGTTLSNKGADWRMLFITGDCVDLLLSTGKALDKTHYAPMEGDERLLFSIYNGTPVAVLYRPVVPGTATPIRLMAANLDQIIRLTSAQVAVQRTADGYNLEAAVPLADLNIDPSRPTDLRGDVGVIFADRTGANRALRLYYYNQNTKIVDDLTTEATLQPGDWGQIEMPLGLNLLRNGGFEEPLATDTDSGWAVTSLRNGAAASITSDIAHSGKQSLLLESDPATFTPESYNWPDYTAFKNSANGGKGGGEAVLTQTISVTPGKQYWVRVHYRTTNMALTEKKNPGPNRGYITLTMNVNWLNAKNPRLSWQNIFWTWADYNPWQTAWSNSPNMVSAPITAPEGSTKANVLIRLVDLFADKHPRVFLDDIEFVEATGP
ncbi:MAG TPA: FlgD immunoglobulin-like domain containing protein, partial [Armatimonadota bacterium]